MGSSRDAVVVRAVVVRLAGVDCVLLGSTQRHIARQTSKGTLIYVLTRSTGTAQGEDLVLSCSIPTWNQVALVAAVIRVLQLTKRRCPVAPAMAVSGMAVLCSTPVLVCNNALHC